MLLLAADTSGKHGSIALAQCKPGACAVVEVVPLAGGTFSAQLVPQIAALLEKHGFSKHDLGGFAVASGPGSFTGLRVGLAAIKGLAEVLQKPIAAVSLLEAVAEGRDGRLFAVLDAGRGEMYVGEFEDGKLTSFGEQLLTRDELRDRLRGRPCTGEDARAYIGDSVTSTVVTPDQAVAEMIGRTGADVVVIERPRSDAIARIGWKKIQAGQTVSPEELEANYIRRSDAEIAKSSS